jgi:hypothetical protein
MSEEVPMASGHGLAGEPVGKGPLLLRWAFSFAKSGGLEAKFRRRIGGKGLWPTEIWLARRRALRAGWPSPTEDFMSEEVPMASGHGLAGEPIFKVKKPLCCFMVERFFLGENWPQIWEFRGHNTYLSFRQN